MPFNKSKESLKQTPQQQNPYIKIITQMKIQKQNQQKKKWKKKKKKLTRKSRHGARSNRLRRFLNLNKTHPAITSN
jgi:hypothetical protein